MDAIEQVDLVELFINAKQFLQLVHKRRETSQTHNSSASLNIPPCADNDRARSIVDRRSWATHTHTQRARVNFDLPLYSQSTSHNLLTMANKAEKPSSTLEIALFIAFIIMIIFSALNYAEKVSFWATHVLC